MDNLLLQDYIERHCSSQGDVLAYIERDTYLHALNPRMVSGPLQGRFIAMLSRMIRPKRILELGTFTGYSTVCLAEGLDTRQSGCELITIEKNDELEERIRRNLSKSEVAEYITLLIGEACDILPTLSGVFDLIFIDADKREYPQYLSLCLPLLSDQGWIVADNTLWSGHIIDPAYDKDPQTQALRVFNDLVADDPSLQSVLLPIRDGITLIRKK